MDFLEVSEKLTHKELEETESKLGISFTEEFKEHYEKYNGGYPAKSNFLRPTGDKTNINHFFSIKYKGFSQLEKRYMDLFVYEKVLPVGFLPFASDDGGNLFCISTLPDSYNKVFFCDTHHYDENDIDEYFTLISDSFNEFIESLVD